MTASTETFPTTHGVPQWHVGDFMRKAREGVNLTQSEMAQALGFSLKSVTNWERGHVRPRPAVLMAWAMRTGVPLWWLEGAEEPRPDDPIGARQGLPRQDLNLRPSD